MARPLERAWEEKLVAQQELDEAYHRFISRQPRVLTAEERHAIRRFAVDISGLWTAPTTDVTDRKEIVERVVVDAQGQSERVHVRIDWVGGGQTEGEMIRDIARLRDLSYYPQVCERIRTPTDQGCSAAAIAAHLNSEGYHPARQEVRFGLAQVTEIQRRLGILVCRPRVRDRQGLGPEENTAAEPRMRGARKALCFEGRGRCDDVQGLLVGYEIIVTSSVRHSHSPSNGKAN